MNQSKTNCGETKTANYMNNLACNARGKRAKNWRGSGASSTFYPHPACCIFFALFFGRAGRDRVRETLKASDASNLCAAEVVTFSFSLARCQTCEWKLERTESQGESPPLGGRLNAIQVKSSSCHRGESRFPALVPCISIKWSRIK